MGEDEFLDEKWVLKFLGYTLKTIQNMQSKGTMLKPIQRGKNRRYLKKDFWEWYLQDQRKSGKKAS